METTTERQKVLVIDDSITTQNLIEKVLIRDSDIEIIQAHNGEEGINKLIEHTDIKLALIDITMPDLDGIELLKLIKKYFNKREFKISMMSGRNTENYIKKCLTLGCDDYIIKPFDLERFKNKVKYYLGKSSQKEIHTTYKKDVSFTAALDDTSFEFNFHFTTITEYDTNFISPIGMKENSLIKIKLPSEQKIFTQKKSIELMIKTVEQSANNDYICSARFINLTQLEEQELRAFVINDYKGV